MYHKTVSPHFFLNFAPLLYICAAEIEAEEGKNIMFYFLFLSSLFFLLTLHVGSQHFFWLLYICCYCFFIFIFFVLKWELYTIYCKLWPMTLSSIFCITDKNSLAFYVGNISSNVVFHASILFSFLTVLSQTLAALQSKC